MRYYFEAQPLQMHNLRYLECSTYWTLFDGRRGHKYPIGYVVNVEDAQRIIDLLNQSVIDQCTVESVLTAETGGETSEMAV